MTSVRMILTYTMACQICKEKTHETYVHSHITEMQGCHCESQWICSDLKLVEEEAVSSRYCDHL